MAHSESDSSFTTPLVGKPAWLDVMKGALQLPPNQPVESTKAGDGVEGEEGNVDAVELKKIQARSKVLQHIRWKEWTSTVWELVAKEQVESAAEGELMQEEPLGNQEASDAQHVAESLS